MAPMKVALITASSAGLGAAIAKHLVSDMRVVINYSSSVDRANAVLEDLSSIVGSRDSNATDDRLSQDSREPQSGPQFHAIRADLGHRSDIKQLVSETLAVMGRLDVVVSNAGWTKMRDFADLEDNIEEGDWDRCFNINVKSHLYLFHAAKEHLHVSEGSFITTASVAGVKPSGSSLVREIAQPYEILEICRLMLLIGISSRTLSPRPLRSISSSAWQASQVPKSE